MTHPPLPHGPLVGELRGEWKELDAKIEALNGEFVELARNDAATRRLTSIPGVGVLNATALIAAVGDASSFAKARDLGSWLGLVPRQHTTGVCRAVTKPATGTPAVC